MILNLIKIKQTIKKEMNLHQPLKTIDSINICLFIYIIDSALWCRLGIQIMTAKDIMPDFMSDREAIKIFTISKFIACLATSAFFKHSNPSSSSRMQQLYIKS